MCGRINILAETSVAWLQQTRRRKVWDVMTPTDEAVILLQGSSALTVDLKSWAKLSRLHDGNRSTTKVVCFELLTSPLGSSKYLSQ